MSLTQRETTCPVEKVLHVTDTKGNNLTESLTQRQINYQCGESITCH